MDRRSFLKAAAGAAGILGGPLMQGCARGNGLDLVIKGGMVYDGLGGPAVADDVGISQGCIVSVGKPGSSGRAHPLVGVGCDSWTAAPYGIWGRGRPHPRAYGTFPRALGKYVRDEKLLPLETMIQKLTSVPAARFGFQKRGAVKPGYHADLVVFDPDKIADKATWEAPHQYPEGISYVIVNGRVAVEHNRHTGALAGRVLRKGA